MAYSKELLRNFNHAGLHESRVCMRERKQEGAWLCCRMELPAEAVQPARTEMEFADES